MAVLLEGSQYHSGFSPQSVPDCVLWLDALDSNSFTYSSGSNVASWRDKSGRNNNSTSVINTPTLRANSINGKPAVFISSNAVRGAFSNTISNRQVHCFMVCTALSTNGSYPRFLGLDDGVNGEYNATTGIEAIGRQGGANFVVSRLNNPLTANAADDVPPLVTTFNNISNHYIAVDGSLNVLSTSSGSTGNFAISRWNVGCETGGSLQWNPQVYIGEILVFSNALASNVRYEIEGYLATKWGLTSNIPAAHPYKTQTIFVRPFMPIDISGCALWVDAADSSTVTVSGSNVTSVVDKSPSKVTLSNSSGFTYPNNTFNGTYPSFFVSNGGQGVGGTQRLGVNSSLSLSTPFTVAFAAQQVGGNFGYVLDSANGSGRPYIYGPTINTAAGGGGSNLTNPSVVVVTFAPTGGSSGFQNGTSAFSGASVALTTGGITIGNRFNLAESWPGHLCEFIVYNGVLTSGQRQQLETYLANKWGLRGSTPSSHFARLAPALTTRFTPLSVDACLLWLDAADQSTLTITGSNVTRWVDKSGRGYTMSLQPSGCAFPIVGSNLNGLTTVGINTSSTGIKQATVIDGFKNAFWVRKERGGNQGYMFYFGADGTYDFHTGDSLQFAHGGFSPQGVRDASLSMFTSNGVTTGTLSTTTMPSGGLTNLVSISNATGSTKLQGLSYDRGNTTRSATCDWGELILYSTALSTFDVKRVEGYLAWKWGVASYLPTTHPFKTFKP
jgi:hypothetical protein